MDWQLSRHTCPGRQRDRWYLHRSAFARPWLVLRQNGMCPLGSFLLQKPAIIPPCCGRTAYHGNNSSIIVGFSAKTKNFEMLRTYRFNICVKSKCCPSSSSSKHKPGSQKGTTYSQPQTKANHRNFGKWVGHQSTCSVSSAWPLEIRRRTTHAGRHAEKTLDGPWMYVSG